ncbi:MAG TPA: cysteine hydrolase family protein [Chryseosolibacter sp.]
MKNTAFIIIDLQDGFNDEAYWGGNRNNPQAEQNTRKVLDTWRELKYPVFHVKHNSVNPKSPLAPGKPGNAIKEIVKPMADEPVIPKKVNSAFIGTDLEAKLRAKGITRVVLAGLQTDHCVSTSARMAANLGFETIVLSDATATFDRTSQSGQKFSAQTIHDINLTSLHDEFATILTTQQLLERVRTHEYAA